MRTSLKIAVLLAALPGIASVQAATLIPVPAVPGSVYTAVQSINDDNVISGYYEPAEGGIHAFYGTLEGNYTTFDFDSVNYPGTEARGINNKGEIVGIANEIQGNLVAVVEFERFANGTMKVITNGGTPLAGIAGGINTKGVFAVEDWHADSSADGFTGKKAKAKDMVDLGFTAVRVRPRGVTVSGDVIGYTKVTSSTGYQGFILHDGSTTLINYPDENATQTLLEGVNSKGIMPGLWNDADGDEFAFYYDANKTTFTPITVPGYPLSAAGGVNSAGLIAIQGYSADFSQTVSYIYCPKKPSKCPAGGFEIADPKPVAAIPGFKPRAVPDPAALTPLKARRLMQQ
jgi:hypothetical protein